MGGAMQTPGRERATLKGGAPGGGPHCGVCEGQLALATQWEAAAGLGGEGGQGEEGGPGGVEGWGEGGCLGVGEGPGGQGG